MSTESSTNNNLSQDEKEKSIKYIVAQGVVTPQMHCKNIQNKVKFCNLKTAFCGISDCIFIGIIVGMIFWLMFLQVDKELIGCGVYLLSPLTYIIIYSLAVWKETAFKLYEMKMVCRYNLQLLSTFRMLYFSIINLVLNSTMLLIMQAVGISEMVLGKLLGISFAAIFLYGIVMLFLRWKKKTVVSQLICSIEWIVANVLLISLFGKSFEKFLLNLPGYIVLGIVGISSVVYLLMLFLNMSKRIEGETEYALN